MNTCSVPMERPPKHSNIHSTSKVIHRNRNPLGSLGFSPNVHKLDFVLICPSHSSNIHHQACIKHLDHHLGDFKTQHANPNKAASIPTDLTTQNHMKSYQNQDLALLDLDLPHASILNRKIEFKMSLCSLHPITEIQCKFL